MYNMTNDDVQVLVLISIKKPSTTRLSDVQECFRQAVAILVWALWSPNSAVLHFVIGINTF